MAKKKVKPHVPETFRRKDVLQCHDEAGRNQFPVLSALLYPVYDQGVTIWQGGVLRAVNRGADVFVTLECPQEGKIITAKTDSILTILEALEDVLSVPEPAWEKSWAAKKEELAALKAARYEDG